MNERALVVDDDPVLLGVCARALARLGLSVDTATDADQARGLLAAGAFDLVLTDVQMPSAADGVVLAEEIKSRSPETCVIIMTAEPSLATAIPSLKHGAADYLEKPFEIARLQALVERCLARRRLAAELDEKGSLRRELDAAYAQLQKAEEAKDALLARASHELRTPLAVARLSAGLLSENLADEQSRELMKRLEAGLEGLGRITEELLLYAKLSRRELAPELAAADVPALCAELVLRYRPLWEERGLSVDLVVEGPARAIPAERALLETALGNLLLNAIRFNAQGGRVVVRCRFDEKAVDVSVEDTGIGIPDSELSNVFEGFYQVAHYLTRTQGGLGLGLATARLIVEAHGGTIAARRNAPRGMIFAFSLPAPAA